MTTTLLFSNSFSPLPHRPFGNKRSTHQLRRPAFTLKTLLIPSFKESFHSSPLASNSLPLFTRRFQLAARISTGDTETKKSSDDDDESSAVLLMGEDSASFDLAQQKISSWIYFSLILGVVLFVLDFVWIDNSTGLGKAFVDAVSGLSGSHEVVMLTLILIFAIVHSGLASLRDVGEKLIGERAFRVLFAGTSLPLAVYFINHRYDGQQLWQLQSVPGLHQFVWLSSFISFFFLYPSTFNLLEVAAVEKPKMHLWETGIMRITRHPQMVGQVVWCLTHTLILISLSNFCNGSLKLSFINGSAGSIFCGLHHGTGPGVVSLKIPTSESTKENPCSCAVSGRYDSHICAVSCEDSADECSVPDSGDLSTVAFLCFS